ncbi:MAG: DUF3299 domain-containing protein, partial [Limnobacter sp.]|nr:DUF3299 domain-containing protein [Limnobacter sp.]
MFIRFVLVISFLFSASAMALTPTDKDIERWVAAWDSLVKPGAYDFVPKNLSFETMASREFQEKVKEAEQAINPSLEGKPIELVGYMVPLDMAQDKVSTFLLVPSAGQCVHVPPPPVNQTVLVDASKSPVEAKDLYAPIVINGTMSIKETKSE